MPGKHGGSRMRILVMGAGALGGYFGARLQAAGHEVVYVARGAHLAALQKSGLQLHSPKGDLSLPEITAVEVPPASLAPDYVLFTVKNSDVEGAAAALLPALGPQTAIVTVQNGISAPERLSAVVGARRVVPGVARIPGDIAAPGVIRHSAEIDRLSFGEADGTRSARVEALHRALTDAGCTPDIPDNITHDLWLKFISQSVMASITALTRLDMGPLLANPASRRLFYDAMAEVFAVGQARVPDLPGNSLDVAWQWMQRLHPTMHASMLDDLTRGKPLENDYLSGDVVRLGRAAGVPTPIHTVFHAALAPYNGGAPQT